MSNDSRGWKQRGGWEKNEILPQGRYYSDSGLKFASPESRFAVGLVSQVANLNVDDREHASASYDRVREHSKEGPDMKSILLR